MLPKPGREASSKHALRHCLLKGTYNETSSLKQHIPELLLQHGFQALEPLGFLRFRDKACSSSMQTHVAEDFTQSPNVSSINN
jgi:hypothetical protein